MIVGMMAAPQKLLELNVHGVSVVLSGECAPGVLDFIKKYFAAYVGNGNALASIEVVCGKAPFPRKACYLFKTRMFKVYQKRLARICRYDEEHWLSLSRTPQGVSAFVSGIQEESVIEMLTILLLSQIGEAMDKLGLHRLHAVGFAIGNLGIVIPGPSKGGKSCLAFKILSHTNLPLLSEESVLLDKELRAYSFATPISLRDTFVKTKLPEPVFGNRFQRRGLELKHLVNIPHERIAPAGIPAVILDHRSRWSSVKIAWNLLWGIGNAQMVELMLRPENILQLGQIFVARLKVSLLILIKNDSKKFPLRESANDLESLMVLQTNTNSTSLVAPILKTFFANQGPQK